MADASEETKSKILTSAKTEFLEKGFTNASLRTIAANAGLTTGAMYRHFKDKDALFCVLVSDAKADDGLLSSEDKDIIHVICERFKNCTSREISAISHEEPAWRKYYETHSRIPFVEAFTLKAV